MKYFPPLDCNCPGWEARVCTLEGLGPQEEDPTIVAMVSYLVALDKLCDQQCALARSMNGRAELSEHRWRKSRVELARYEAPQPYWASWHIVFQFCGASHLKFGRSDNPIEVDDWLHKIEMKLDVVHANDRDQVLLLGGRATKKSTRMPATWSRMNLLGYSMSTTSLTVKEYLHKFTELSRFALYEVDTDEKEHDSFLRGLDPGLRTVIGARVYPDFNTMVNKAITTAKNKHDEIKDKKRKFEAKKMYSQEKTLKL
jgi:hypothetical protein